jgi:phage-related protein
MPWQVILFETKRGEKPVEEFIFSLNDNTAAKVAHTVELLEKYGYRLGMPHTKQIEKGLYELRIRGLEEIRIFYTFSGNKIYLLHGFKKKTQKTPGNEIIIALKRLSLLT